MENEMSGVRTDDALESITQLTVIAVINEDLSLSVRRKSPWTVTPSYLVATRKVMCHDFTSRLRRLAVLLIRSWKAHHERPTPCSLLSRMLHRSVRTADLRRGDT